MQYLILSWALPNEAVFPLISTVLLYLQVAQMPRCGDLVILVTTIDNRQNQLLYSLHAHMHMHMQDKYLNVG